MQQNDTINLLISCESQAQLEGFLGQFREAGQATRAQRVASLRNLGDLLKDPQWDLLIATDRHPELTPVEALATIAERQGDLPCIVRLAEARGDAALACLRQGAREVIGAEEGERLVRAALREVAAVREHRELLQLRVQYEEIARRAELLLAASQDAIAYVVDGMHVHANDLYASLFGYAGVDDLPSVPLVDLIAAGNQQAFKEALRRYRSNPQEQTAIEFTGLRADSSEFAGQLVLSTASFEGETCMQVLVRAASVSSIAPAAPAAPAPAGESSPRGLDALRTALAGVSAGHLLLIGIDGYAQHCRNLGVRSAYRLVDDAGAFLARSLAWPAAPLRVGDAVLAVIDSAASAETISALGRRVVEQMAGNIQPSGEQSVSCSVTVTACPLDSLASEGADRLLDRAYGAFLAGAEQSAARRAADPARLQVLASPNAAPVAAAASAFSADGGLADAVRLGQFRILFQPIVSLRGDSSEYYEVQVLHAGSGKPACAWLHEANLGDASLDLDKWVVIETLKKLAAHRARHPATRVLLPVGAGALLDGDFAKWLGLALRGAELAPECVALQLAHRVVGSYLRQAGQLAENLRALGCQLCISEIHSANNPIEDLAHLKPQFARIDATLSQALRDNESTNTVLKPLVESLHQEQIVSIMPNVEGAGVLAVLWQLGVHFIQGDYLQPPQPDMHYEFADIA